MARAVPAGGFAPARNPLRRRLAANREPHCSQRMAFGRWLSRRRANARSGRGISPAEACPGRGSCRFGRGCPDRANVRPTSPKPREVGPRGPERGAPRRALPARAAAFDLARQRFLLFRRPGGQEDRQWSGLPARAVYGRSPLVAFWYGTSDHSGGRRAGCLRARQRSRTVRAARPHRRPFAGGSGRAGYVAGRRGQGSG